MPLDIPPLPPLADVMEMVQTRFLPAAGAAAIVFGILALAGKRARPVASAVAIVAGLLAGNWYNSPFPIAQWKEPSAARFYLPHAAVLLLIVGCFASLLEDLTTAGSKWSRFIVTTIVWNLRAFAVGIVAYFVLPSEVGLPFSMFFAVLSLSLWFTLERSSLDGSGAEAGLIAYLGCATAGGVMLFAHYASFMDYAMILGASFLGLAVIAAHGKFDLRGAVPAYVGIIPGLLVSGKTLTDSQTPPTCFWIAGLLPLIALPGLIPVVNRNLGRYAFVLRVGLVMLVSVGVLGWAAQHEKLPWQEEW